MKNVAIKASDLMISIHLIYACNLIKEFMSVYRMMYAKGMKTLENYLQLEKY